MSKPDAFVLPAGLHLESSSQGYTIEYDGDVVLNSSLGQRIHRVTSRAGDVTIHVDADLDEISAPAGAVTVSGRLRASRVTGRSVTLAGDATVDEARATDGALKLQGKVEGSHLAGTNVELAGTSITAKVIEGSATIHVAGGKIQADLLIAPQVTLARETSGKITVVESHNELGPHAVRGCLRLGDLEEMFGNADAFLAERGGAGLGASAPPAAADTAGEPSVEQGAPAAEADSGPSAEIIDDEETPSDAAVAEQRPAMSDEQLDTIVEEDSADVKPAVDNPLHQQVIETLDRIVQCYADAELPPAIAELQVWVNARDYRAIRENITDIWNQIIKFHRGSGLRIQPQVTTNFNTLNATVRKMM